MCYKSCAILFRGSTRVSFCVPARTVVLSQEWEERNLKVGSGLKCDITLYTTFASFLLLEGLNMFSSEVASIFVYSGWGQLLYDLLGKKLEVTGGVHTSAN